MLQNLMILFAFLGWLCIFHWKIEFLTEELSLTFLYILYYFLQDELSLEYTSSIEMAKMTWTGKTKIPFSYFPVGVNKFNAYAIHGTGLNRTYEALYPIEREKYKDPDL